MKGIVARARPRAAVAGLAALAAGLAGPALAAEMDAPIDVRGIDVNANRQPLDADTQIAVLPTTVQDTPQAITVITNEQLRTQGVTTLDQALRNNAPGITVAIGEGGVMNGDQFKIRGLPAQDDVYVDGLRDFGLYTRDSFSMESVQVLKGPSGALFGRGSPGGAINILSKRPRLTELTTIDVFGGNGNYFRALADVNHQINDTSAFRLNLMVQNSEVVERDYIFTRRWGVAGTIGLGLGTPTSVILNYVHQEDDRRPDYGIPIVQPPGSLIALPASEYDVGVERSSFLGYLDDADDTTADILTARFSHTFNPAFTLTSDARYGRYTRYFQYTNTSNCAAACDAALFDNDPGTIPTATMGGSGPYEMDLNGVQTFTALRFDSQDWPMRTQLIAGFDVSYQQNDKLFYGYTLPAGFTARNQIPRTLVDPNPNFPAGYAVYLPSQAVPCPVANCSSTGTTVLETRARGIDLAAFINGRVWLTDTVSVLGSVRYDRYTATLDTLLVNGTISRIEANSDIINPRVSLLWEPSDATTVYFTWGRASTPPGSTIVNAGTPFTNVTGALEPEVVDSYELGARVGFYDGRLSLTGAVFHIEKDNATLPDPNGTGFLIASSGEQQEFQGVELGLIGQLPGGWSISANYAFVDSEITAFYTNCSATTLPCAAAAPAATPTLNTLVIGRDVYFTPEHSASVWTTWDIPDTGWQVGGGGSYQSEYFTNYVVTTAAGNTAITRIAMIPESINFDAFVAYRWDRYRVALNVNNIADRLNYSQGQNNRGVPTPGRTFILSVSSTF